MNCKPIPISQAEPGDTPIQLLSRIITNIYETIKNEEYFLCGGCKNFILVYNKETKEKPIKCPICLCDVDWVGLNTKLINRCPRCPRQYPLFYRTCPYDAINLVRVEVPIAGL